MTPPGRHDDPAHTRASELLALVATRERSPSPAFAARVVRTARLQLAIARPLRALGTFVAALAGSVGHAGATALRGRRRR